MWSRLFPCSIFITIALSVSLGVNANISCASWFWGVALDGYPITAGMLNEVERETGLFPQIVVFFVQWPSSPKPGGFPKESLEAIWMRGALPCLTWEPMYYKGGEEIMVSYEQILGAEYDPYLTAFAREARSWGKPFLIRFAHEMNIERYHWGTEKGCYGPKSPEIYKGVFQYVVSLFQKVGAHNVLWVFCPNAESVPNTSFDPGASWNRASNYYPGESYVDILGMDGYNWGTTQTVKKNGWKSHWKSFEEIFRPIYRELKALSPQKPIFVFETASANQGGQKSPWIKEAFLKIDEWNIDGLVWFHVKKEVDWRINSDGDTSYVSLVRSRGSRSRRWIKDFAEKDR